jgi:hypothetical protein
VTGNAEFSRTWKSGAREGLGGTCIDRIQSAWTVSLPRGPGHPVERQYNVPRMDLSRLSTAEKAAFTGVAGAGVSRNALAWFLRTV